jgi:hypothetical protein
VAKYGGQSALVYPFVPDKNMEDMLKFFNYYPKRLILKRPFLRFIEKKAEEEIKSLTMDLKPSTESQSSIQQLVSYNPTFG